MLRLLLLAGLPLMLMTAAPDGVGVVSGVGIFTCAGLVLALVALVCEYVDSSLGMGYGTILTPLLLLFFGYAPLEIVPAVLFSELVTGLLAAVAHHRAGNVNLRAGERDFKVAMVLAASSICGTLVAVSVAVNISKTVLKLYIGILVLTMGLIIPLMRNRQARFSWKKLFGLGMLASFNKGMSGGGYGPVVTCGQIISGIEGKRAIGITALSEGLTCAVGLLAFGLMEGGPDWSLALPLVTGAVCSVPFSAWSVKRIKTKDLTLAIGVFAVLLGTATLAKVVLSLVR